jgi:dihydroorotate dehydrogenase
MDGFTLAGHQLESPLVSTAGSINGIHPGTILREVGELSETGIGAITVGSFTVPPQQENETKFGAPVYYYDAEAEKTYNSMGLPNIGLAAGAALASAVVLRAHDKGKPIIYSCSPTNAPEHGNSIDQAVHLVRTFLATDIDLVELNVSCPNLVTEGGGRKPIMGYDLEAMEELVERLGDEIGDTGRLGLKLPPYMSNQEKLLVPCLAKIIQGRDVFRFLTTPNAIPNQIPLYSSGLPILTVPGGSGGMSGPATKETGREQLRLWRQHTDKEIISALGVDCGAELASRLQLGAAAAGGVTFLWESRNWKAAVTDMLTGLADAI